MNPPLISVIMPVFNSERYVAEAVASILAQTYKHLELIIVDDGSTDASPGIIRDFAARDSRIHAYFLEHGGVARTMNAGVVLAQGDFIARMDHDDIALPERLATQLAWMQHHDLDICGSCAKQFGDDDRILWFPETHQAICSELLLRCAMLYPTAICRAAVLKEHPHDEQSTWDDYELWTRLALRCRMGNVPQVLLKYRIHTQQSSRVQAEAINADRARFRRRYFHASFPDATSDDYNAVARIADKEPFPCLTSLELAGTWLLRLAETSDRFSRRAMSQYWLKACLKSTHLGPRCYRIYCIVAPQFGMPSDPLQRRLQVACALRIRAGSRLGVMLHRAMKKLRVGTA